MIKIASINLCLGLQAPKNIIKEMILENNIDILCMQETQIQINLDHNCLSFPNYNIEVEQSTICSSVAIYIKNNYCSPLVCR